MSKRLRKGEAVGQLGRSTWILKSPVIINSEGEVARSSSRVVNSERKMDLEDDGGRYTVRRMNENGLVPEVVVKRAQRDSKVVNGCRGILDILRVER